MRFSRTTEQEHEPAVIDGWEIGRLLARRPGGATYELYRSNGDVAALSLSADICEDRRERSRLRRLTRLRGSLVHPHLLRVHSTGELGGRPYLITELPPELTLQSLGTPLAQKTCIRILAETASALDAAHERRLVHQALGTDSVLLRSAARHVLLDEFGLTATCTRRERSDLHLALNFRYAPPELVRGELPDKQSNIYSLACMLFEGLTGAAPFERGHPAWVEAYAHVSEPPPLASERRSELTTALDEVLASGMSKEAEDRPGSASELVFAAARALDLEPPAAIAHVRRALPAPAAAPRSKRAKQARGELAGGNPTRSEPARGTLDRSKPVRAKAAVAAPTPTKKPAGRTRGSAKAPPAWRPAPASRKGGSRPAGHKQKRRTGARRGAVAIAVLAAAAVAGFTIGGGTTSEPSEPNPQQTASSQERVDQAAALKSRQDAIAGLDAERRAGRAALAGARTPTGQARAADRLERAYSAAAARLTKVENASLAAAMEATGASYAALAKAARGGDRAKYRSARRAVSRSEERLNDAIAALRRS